MSDLVQKQFDSKPKIRIVKAIFKDKNGNIVGEYDNEHNRHKTR